MKALLLVVVVVAFGQQVRDAPRFPTGTAVLSGTVVVDEPNGQPVRRALVSISLAASMTQTTTDDRGRFTITGLPAGNMRLVVSKPGYVVTYYGALQPGSTVGRPIALTNGAKVDVTIRIPRGAVISGTVLDPDGQPMSAVGVRVQRVTVSASGQRTLTPQAGPVIPSTDDRGMYRVYGLAAGDYIVMAQPRMPGMTPGGQAEVRPTSSAELQWAERQMRGGAAGSAPGTAQSPEVVQPVAYAAAYFPGAANVASAGIVSVGAGQERTGIDLRMQFIPTARVEGTVTTGDGQPARGFAVTLIPEADMVSLEAERLMVLMEVGLAVGSLATTATDGSFSIPGVEPGNYTLLARTAVTAGRGTGSGGSIEPSWAMADVRVDGRDIKGIALRLSPAQKLSGRVNFEGAAPAAPIRTSITMRPQTSRGVGVSAPPIALSNGDPFIVTGLIPSPYRLIAGATGWTLKSATLGGRDIADASFEIKPGEDVSGLVLTFTDSPAEITGVLYDGAGRPAGDMFIVLFSADRAMWFGGSRRVRPAVRPATDGRFMFASLVAGEYYLAALTDVGANDLANPSFLEQIIPAAVKITVADGEKKTQDFRIAR